VHIHITEIRLGKNELYLFVGIDRGFQDAYVEWHERMTQPIARAFLDNLLKDCPFSIHTILTDNSAPFTAALLAERLRPKHNMHLFDQTCATHGIRHGLTKFRHPWTNGQVEVFNRTIKGHTTKRYHYDTPAQPKNHIMAFLFAYNFQRQMKAWKYQSPYDTSIETYKQKTELFHFTPL